MSYSFTSSSSHKIVYNHLAGLDGATKLSVSYWVKGTTINDDWCSIFDQRSDGNNGCFVGIYNNVSTQPTFGARNAENGISYPPSDTVPASAWHHVFWAYDGSWTFGARTRLWVDGTEITLSLANSSTSIASTGTTAFSVGWGLDGYFDGKIAELAMWIGEAITDETNVIDPLAIGGNPETVKNEGLDVYLPLRADADDTKSVLTVSTNNATLDTGDHPDVDTGVIGTHFAPTYFAPTYFTSSYYGPLEEGDTWVPKIWFF